MSGFKGDNLIDPSTNMPWYKGFEVNVAKGVKVNGVTLLDAFNKVVQVPKRKTDCPVRVPISELLKLKELVIL